MSALPVARLTAPERGRLGELEAVVEAGLQTFLDVGRSLAEIRDSSLYRETHATFEAYLDDRFHVSRRHGYRLIDAARVAELVCPMGHIDNERQARELVPLMRTDEAEVVKVWRELRAEFGGEITAPRIRRLVRGRMQRVEREQARAERLVAPVAIFGDIELRRGDFRQVLADIEGTADALITDPPYESAWIRRDAADFASAAARMLSPAGQLVVLFGQLQQYELKPYLDETLCHRWTGVYLMPGSRARMFHPRVATGWKPILVYTRHDAPRPEFLRDDVFVSEAADKVHHYWGQSASGIEALVEAFSRPGDLVVDPFLGGGTTAVVCRDLGRRFVGCDIDDAALSVARARLVEQETE